MSADSKMEEMRRRYLAEAVQTASPAVRLTMILDALEMDMAQADAAFADGRDLKAISDRLLHAQEILLVLRDTLDTSTWDAGPRLWALYDYLHRELVMANIDKDRARASDAADHIRQLAGAWRQAASQAEVPVGT